MRNVGQINFNIVKDYGVLRHFQQYFSYIVVVSFIGGWNWSTRGKPTTTANHWQTFSRKYCFEYISPPAGFELTTLVVKGIDCIILIGFFVVAIVTFTDTVYMFHYEIHLKYYQDTNVYR